MRELIVMDEPALRSSGDSKDKWEMFAGTVL